MLVRAELLRCSSPDPTWVVPHGVEARKRTNEEKEIKYLYLQQISTNGEVVDLRALGFSTRWKQAVVPRMEGHF